MSIPNNLRRLAQKCGIESTFIDSSGRRRKASPETLRALLSAWGVPAQTDSDVASALALRAEAERHRCIPPVCVQWDMQPSQIKLAKVLESPTVRITQLDADLNSAERGIDAQMVNTPSGIPSLALPGLPFGYHPIEVLSSSGRFESLVISAPSKAYAPHEMRAWGVFLPMYAAWRTEPASWPSGTFTDFAQLGRRISRHGGSVISTLPLMGAFIDDWKSEPSPYSPATRLFWNEFFIDVADIPDLATSSAATKLLRSSGFRRDLASLRDMPLVDYEREMALKRKLLERVAADFFATSSDRRRAFDEFVASRPELLRYAVFRAVCEKQRRSWHQWPERLRAGDFKPSDYPESARNYFVYAQWIAQQQVAALLHARNDNPILSGDASQPPSLYLDLPLGVNPDGYDVWRERERFALNASVGAPPDAFFTKGQNWGFPPLHPEWIRMDGYKYVIEYLRFQMRHASLLRLDHVMGLHRLWWVPHGASAADGAYVKYNAEELYAILCLESARHRTMLVGENLGTVPPQVNVALKRHGVRTMYVVQYEASEDARRPLREPPRESVAGINTHDMPTWASHWEGRDIVDRRELGLLKTTEVSSEAKRRARVRRALETFLKKKGYLKGKADARSVLAALLRFLAQSRTELVLINLEDLWLEPEPQNTPGTSTERVNWRRKTSRSFDEMLARPEIEELLGALDRKPVEP